MTPNHFNKQSLNSGCKSSFVHKTSVKLGLQLSSPQIETENLSGNFCSFAIINETKMENRENDENRCPIVDDFAKFSLNAESVFSAPVQIQQNYVTDLKTVNDELRRERSRLQLLNDLVRKEKRECWERIRVLEKNILDMEVDDIQDRLRRKKEELKKLEAEDERIQLKVLRESCAMHNNTSEVTQEMYDFTKEYKTLELIKNAHNTRMLQLKQIEEEALNMVREMEIMQIQLTDFHGSPLIELRRVTFAHENLRKKQNSLHEELTRL